MAERLVAGLEARRDAGAGPIALVPCDNVPHNAAALRSAVDSAASGDADLIRWIEQNVSFVSTVVDRITPATTDDDRAIARRLAGWDDACPVVTEPFSEWILAGDFPAGRPRWEDVGVRFVDDIGVYERRKLWLLNGAHSLLSYAGALRGHATVAAAMSDQTCAGWVDEWWDSAQRHLAVDPSDMASYRIALADRFSNPRIQHRLAQIGMDGSRKLPIRVAPVLRAELDAGNEPVAAARVLAAWIRHLRCETFPVRDPSADVLTEAARHQSDRDAVRAVLGIIAPDLIDNGPVVPLVQDLMASMLAGSGARPGRT